MDNEVSSGGLHIVCQYSNNVATFGYWLNKNPLNYTVPLLLLQLSVISLVSMLIEICLHPLGQSSIVSQILSGILFGPSVLRHKSVMGPILFPARSILSLETAAVFGLMFFLFAIGIRTDTRMMVRPARPAVILGFFAMFITALFTIPFSLLLKTYVRMDDSLAAALPAIAAGQSMTAFPNVSCLLIELRMASTDLGQIASSTAVLCDIIGIMMLVVNISILHSNYDPRRSVLSMSSAFLFILAMAYVVGPFIRRVMKRIPPGKPLGDTHVFFCFAGVLAAGFATELIGQHFILGPVMLGFVVPDGPPLGGPMISKLDLMIGKFLYPTFLTTSGLKTNMFTINERSFWIMLVLIVFACMAKIGSVMLASRFFLGMYSRDAFVVGLMLNARGVIELIMYNTLRDGGVLTDQEFALSVLSVIGVMAVITPLIKLLYDPSRRECGAHGWRRQTIQHTKHGMELRILVCIKDQESVSSLVTLLGASNATKYNPVAIIALVLEELVDRATPMLVAHQSIRPDDGSGSSRIVNALRQLEVSRQGYLTVQTFLAVSHLDMAHDDICRVAREQEAALVVLPFHKRWEIDGSIGTVSKAVQSMNVRVVGGAPCSVAILVDRGVVVPAGQVYRVVVVYIGGADDAEALWYGARMGAHDDVALTVVRFLLKGCGGEWVRERKAESGVVEEVRAANVENQNFVYKEEVVGDGVGLAGALKGVEKGFDLVMVGREHGTYSHALKGLGMWSECLELGVVGDLLSSEDWGGTASVLVVQQQRMMWEGRRRMTKRAVVRPEWAGHEDWSPVGRV
ncbi:Cation/H(+) antiporter 15 [Striga hermonthica]|uniref:Cation/H(+) antiporter 15 n=1 Tax=Striga hermonthica TaxID=68872 RepID=A0A9N7RLG8_STRHE|nr:Cation/H(+) antiporter 15 [Striga hermonthica]